MINEYYKYKLFFYYWTNNADNKYIGYYDV